MPEIYGWEHLLYLAIVILLMELAFFWIHQFVKTEKAMERVIRIAGAVLFAAIIWNRISVCYYRDGFAQFLPGTFCGASSLILAISTMFVKKNAPIFHCIAYTALLGGFLTLAYPDFIGQSDSIFYPMTISGLVHHTIDIFLVLLMIKTGFLKPELKKWIYLPIGHAIYMAYGLFLITVLGYADAMYIYTPVLSGTPLYWWLLGLLCAAVHLVFLGIWESVKKPKTDLKTA